MATASTGAMLLVGIDFSQCCERGSWDAARCPAGRSGRQQSASARVAPYPCG